jgi:hypothetical protein
MAPPHPEVAPHQAEQAIARGSRVAHARGW